jgi:hypothetical protein
MCSRLVTVKPLVMYLLVLLRLISSRFESVMIIRRGSLFWSSVEMEITFGATRKICLFQQSRHLILVPGEGSRTFGLEQKQDILQAIDLRAQELS